MVDLEPATRTQAVVVGAVRDDQLTAPTPCTESWQDERGWHGMPAAGGILVGLTGRRPRWSTP